MRHSIVGSDEDRRPAGSCRAPSSITAADRGKRRRMDVLLHRRRYQETSGRGFSYFALLTSVQSRTDPFASPQRERTEAALKGSATADCATDDRTPSTEHRTPNTE